jgi:hypothetical protein
MDSPVELGSIEARVVDAVEATDAKSEPVQWIVDVFHEPTGEWCFGNASQFFPAQSPDVRHVFVEVDFDGNNVSIKLPLDFTVVRLIECGGGGQDRFNQIVNESAHEIDWLVKICSENTWEDAEATKVVIATNMLHLKTMPKGVLIDETVYMIKDNSNDPNSEASIFFQHITVILQCMLCLVFLPRTLFRRHGSSSSSRSSSCSCSCKIIQVQVLTQQVKARTSRLGTQ